MTSDPDTAPARPTIRLRPKSDARRLRFGYPWVYDNEVVTDRRTKAIAPGTLALLEDAERQPLGVVAVNPGSRIFARMLDRDPSVEINAQWLEARIKIALSLRERLFDAPYYRLIHAEADGLPGTVIDRFGDTLVLQPNAAWAEAHVEMIADAALNVTGARTLVKNATGRARVLEGLDAETGVLRGEVSGPVPVTMNNATYMADVLSGQKTGLFFDQRPNHAFAARLAQGARVLDVFSHVGGFGLAALANGAQSALCVDGSAVALELAQAGAEASGVATKFETRKGDAFEIMASLAEDKAQFDLVICDPPAFAPSKNALEAGLRAYEKVARQASALVVPGGYLGVCSCSHAADLSKFRQASQRGIGRAGRRAQQLHTGFAGPDHPQHQHLDETGYLKALFFRLD